MATATKTPTKKAAAQFRRATKLSTILALALADLRKAERAKDCRINMNVWRIPKTARRQKCSVCLAGSVMRERFPECITPSDFDDADEDQFNKMLALNNLRMGDVSSAWINIHSESVPPRASRLNRSVKEYSRSDPSPFWADMRKLLADLKKAGL